MSDEWPEAHGEASQKIERTLPPQDGKPVAQSASPDGEDGAGQKNEAQPADSQEADDVLNAGIIWQTRLLRSGTYIRVAVTPRSTCRRTEGTWSSPIVTSLDDLVVLDPSVVLFMTHKSIPTPHLQRRSVSAAASQKQCKSVPSQPD